MPKIIVNIPQSTEQKYDDIKLTRMIYKVK